MRDNLIGTDREPVYGMNVGLPFGSHLGGRRPGHRRRTVAEAAEAAVEPPYITPISKVGRAVDPMSSGGLRTMHPKSEELLKNVGRALFQESPEDEGIEPQDRMNAQVLESINQIMALKASDGLVEIVEMIFDHTTNSSISLHLSKPIFDGSTPGEPIHVNRVEPDADGAMVRTRQSQLGPAEVKDYLEKEVMTNPEWKMKKARIQLNNEFMDMFFTQARDH